MKEMKTVNSLEGLDVGVVYKTENYEMLNNTEGNRTGISERRVKKFQKLIKKDEFINDVSITLVNLKGKKIDGHHRSAAIEREGLPLYFMITDSSEFNGNGKSVDKNRILNNIARINSGVNPAWSKQDHFKSAINSGVPLAMKLNEIKDELIDKFNLSENNISTNDLYGILKRDIKSYGIKITREELENRPLLLEIEKPLFKEEVIFYAKLMTYFKNSPIRSYKAIKQIFREMWADEIDFNRDRFYDNMLKEGYAPKDDSVEEHRRIVRKLALQKRSGRKRIKPEKTEVLESLVLD